MDEKKPTAVLVSGDALAGIAMTLPPGR